MFFTWSSAVVAALLPGFRSLVLYYTLFAIVVGSVVTAVRRLVAIQAEVEALPWPEEKK